MGAVSAMLYTRYEILTDTYTQEHVREFDKRMERYRFMQQRMIDNYYRMFLSSPRVPEIMAQAQHSDAAGQMVLRRELHERMKGVFAGLKEFDTQLLFFHLPGQVGFLRVHKPEEFGDSLRIVRPSLVYAQRSKKKVIAFETGKRFSGFRTIYPLYNQKNYAGSVEIAYPFLALKRQAMLQDHSALTLLVKRSIVMTKTKKTDMAKIYQNSLFGDEYVEDKESALEKGSQGFEKGELKSLLSENKVKIVNALRQEKAQALVFTYRGKNTMIVLSPVKQIDEKYAAYMVEITPNHTLYTTQWHQFLVLLGSIASLLALLMWYIYRYNRSVLLSEQYKKAVEESMIVSRTDPKGIITNVNPLFIEISGYTQQELLGQPHSIVRHPNVPRSVFKEMWHTIQRGKSWHGMLENRTKNGESYFVKNLICPIVDENGKVIEYLGLRHDVSEIENSRLKAQEAQRIKAAFVANMSHEIRTPINGIAGYVHLLSKTILDETQRHYVNIVESSIETLVHIVNDVLDYSKIEEGKIEIELIKSNPKAQLLSAFELFVPQAEIKKIDYKFTMDENIENCLILDILRIKQVLSNLISNALKFTPQEGSVHVKIEIEQESQNDQILKFSVTDTGIGIPKGKQSKIFEKFTQADASITRQFGGTGLGLSIAYAMVDLMGGKITIDSEEGRGATFSFAIRGEKCDETVDDTQLVAEKEEMQLLDLRVLVVDDYPINRMLIGELLSHHYGITADFANNGEEGVSMVTNNSYDLVFMDINMPGMDGIQATRLIRKTHPDLPIVALTANVMKGDAEEFAAAGMNDYLAKPLVYDELHRVLMRYSTSKESQ
ncbi:MAG: ATP-binding protein [Sulfuricurvum sp.]|nr:ATP-binding protein [Sulfuricurvum sp.]